jgi:hypothetical protein
LQFEKHDLHNILTLAGIIIFCKQLDENAHSSIRCNFDPVSNVNDFSERQCEKHDLNNRSILAGIIILYKQLDENAHSSIRCNFDSVSNVSD